MVWATVPSLPHSLAFTDGLLESYPSGQCSPTTHYPAPPLPCSPLPRSPLPQFGPGNVTFARGFGDADGSAS
eukprot:569393-Rhodomonas_salina.1